MNDGVMGIAVAAFCWSLGAMVLGYLAWDFGRRWIGYRSAALLEKGRLDRFETELAEHKKVHAKAIDNLVVEMREAVGEVKTRSSLALERANQAQQRRFGR